jgi:hypothetical protein
MDFEIHGLKFSVLSKNKDFMNYLKFRLKKYKSVNLENEIDFQIYFEKPRESLNEYDKISSTLYKKGKDFIIKYDNLLIEYIFDNKKCSIRAYFFPMRKRHLARILLKGKKKTYSDYYEFFIIRKVIQNTFFAKLEQKGLNVLHAATINNTQGSTLFFGLGGLGKTTLALSLANSDNLRLQGDNFVLIDKKKVYSYLEPTRITKYTKKKVNLNEPVTKKKIKTFGKYNFYLKEDLLFNGKSKIKNIVFPRLSEYISLNKISKKEGIKIIENSMKILKETPEFTELGFIFPKQEVELDNKINFYELFYKDLDAAKALLRRII